MTTDMVCLIIGVATPPSRENAIEVIAHPSTATVRSIEIIASDEAALETAVLSARINPLMRYFIVRATEVRAS